VALGRALLDAFLADHGTTRCRDILGDARLPLRCFGVVGRAPARCGAVESGGRRLAAPPGRQEAHAACCGYLEGCGFHCARAVLRASADLGAARPEHLDAASAFVGGTALAGLTCSALAGGLLLLGHHLGAVENSRLRVLRQVATMAVRGDAFADDRNAFNRAMNRGHDLARWFAGRFDGIGCRELTGCDLDTLDGVRAYVEGDTVAHCAEMARQVAAEADRLASGVAR
jgi:hypothetical protein